MVVPSPSQVGQAPRGVKENSRGSISSMVIPTAANLAEVSAPARLLLAAPLSRSPQYQPSKYEAVQLSASRFSMPGAPQAMTTTSMSCFSSFQVARRSISNNWPSTFTAGKPRFCRSQLLAVSPFRRARRRQQI